MDNSPELESFAHEFFQDVISDSEIAGIYSEEVFIEKFCEVLVEAGEIDNFGIVHYRGPPSSGIRIDGYGGDPNDSEMGVLNLLISDFHPSTEIGRLTKTQMDVIFKRLLKFLNSALDTDWRNSLEESSRAFGLADLISHRWVDISNIRLFLISNRELSDRVDRRDADNVAGKSITYSVWDIKRLYRFVTVGHGSEEISIDLQKDYGGFVPILFAQHAEAEHESYLTILPGEVLARIYDRWGTRLLEQNVRVFLQARGNVNKGIKKTLESEPTMFFAYNNGITATAESVDISQTDQGMVLRKLENFQIVNGGQTTASIHIAFRAKTDLSQIFVQMKLSVVNPTETEKIVPKISQYANSQNRINAADFFSNHPFHIRIEGFSRRIFAPSSDGVFLETRWFYERARGQYADARSLLTQAQRKKFDLENPRSQLITKTDLAKFMNVWRNNPHIVSLGAQKNFVSFAEFIGQKWEKQKDDINEEWFHEAVAKAIIFRTTEKLVSKQDWYQGGYRANIVAYSIAKMAFDISEMKCSVDFQLIWRRQSLNTCMENNIILVAKKVHEVLVDPPEGFSNVTEWAKKLACWNAIRKLRIDWPAEFVENLISTESQRDRNRNARKNQKSLNEIEAQMTVVNAGPLYWKDVEIWGTKNSLLSPMEIDLLGLVSKFPSKIPSGRQSQKLLEVLSKLQEEGFNREIPLTE